MLCVGVGGVKLIKIDGQMLVAVIGARADDEVYDVALRRAEKHGI